MTEVAFFVDLETGEIRSKVLRSVAPSIRVRFNTFLKCVIGFVRDEVAEALADGMGVTLVVKPMLGHTEAAVALDVTATVTGTGTARRYEMQALVTGDVLSGLLNGLDEAVFSLQVAWGTEGAAGYGISEPLEVVIVNAYVRPGDELPDPTGDAAWVLLKETFPQGTPDEVERTLEFDVGGVTDHGELTGLEDDDHPQYLNEDRGDARYAPVGAFVDGDTVAFLKFQDLGVRLLNEGQVHSVQLGGDPFLTSDYRLSLLVNNANRAVNLSGDLTVPGAATVSGTNTGDVTLAGVPDYLTRVGQVITRALINLASHVTGILGRANGGTGLSAAGAVGNVLTSDGTDWTSAAPAAASYASQLQARQGLSSTVAISPATMWGAMQEALFIADFSRFLSTTNTGSGSMLTTGSTPIPQTGTTANSSSRGQWVTQAKSGASAWTTADFSRPSAFGLTLTVGSSGAVSTGIFRVWFGTDTNAASIAARGYGFEIRQHRVWIIAHNGTTLVTQDTGVDISSTSFVLNVMRCVNNGAGSISVFMNNAQIGSALAGGPTTAGTGTLNILNLNGATAAANDIRTLAGTFTANFF
jgi:hypothetical protein